MSFGIGLARLPITLLPVFLVDRLGRRPLILGSTAVSLLSLILMMVGVEVGGQGKVCLHSSSLSSQIVSLIGLTSLLLINACGLGSVSRFYAAELVPRNLLLNAVSVLTAFEALSKIGVEFAWYPLAANVVSQVLLLLNSCSDWCLVSASFPRTDACLPRLDVAILSRDIEEECQ